MATTWETRSMNARAVAIHKYHAKFLRGWKYLVHHWKVEPKDSPVRTAIFPDNSRCIIAQDGSMVKAIDRRGRTPQRAYSDVTHNV